MAKCPRVPLGDIAPKVDAPMPSSDVAVWNLSLADVEADTGAILNRKRCLVSELGSSKCSFDSRHVLYSKLRPYLNKVVVPDQPGVGTSELLPLLPDPERLHRQFLAYYLRSPEFVDFAVAHSRGANLPRVALRTLWTHPIPVPPMAKQRRIVEQIRKAFERWHAVCDLRQQIHNEVATVFSTLLADCFDAFKNAIPIRTVGQVALETRFGTSRRCSRKPNGSPVLRIPNVVDGQVNLIDLKWCDQLSNGELSKLPLQDGDVLVVRTNGSRDLVGRCAVFEEQDRPYVFASYLIRIRPNCKHVHPQFLAFFLASAMGRDAISERMRTSAGQFNINSTNLRSIPLPCPPLEVQRSIVKQMIYQRRILNDLMEAHSNIQNEDVTLRQAVLRKAFTGEF